MDKLTIRTLIMTEDGDIISVPNENELIIWEDGAIPNSTLPEKVELAIIKTIAGYADMYYSHDRDSEISLQTQLEYEVNIDKGYPDNRSVYAYYHPYSGEYSDFETDETRVPANLTTLIEKVNKRLKKLKKDPPYKIS